MELILWRHAEAEDGFPDGGRRLTPKGRKQAAKVGRWLADRLEGRYRLLASPAARAVETAEGLSDKMEVVPELGTSADPIALLAAVGWPGGEGTTVIVVGHQPTLGAAAAYLITGRPEPWAIKKGAAWWFKTSDSGGRQETTLRAVVPPDLA